jgi:hypothetical protein
MTHSNSNWFIADYWEKCDGDQLLAGQPGKNSMNNGSSRISVISMTHSTIFLAQQLFCHGGSERYLGRR